ncbi:E3 ubiquitin-protein ligase CHFR-like, partial [Mizuhopecten yessoensis]|uniref:E3 ubiquitin-protein ligase CHFR-like n=1 Tax=Mizuhopecten yessoensis TaxID=6573 RepID=UPI000B45A3FC
MEDSVDGSWGQLVSVTDVDSPPFPLIEDEFTIGRAKDCDISLANNKLVSGRHCHIEKDAEGQVWLCDTSTNGTLLNVSVKITKGSKKELSHGDEFFVVYKKDEDDINVGYMYQNLEELQKEMNATQEYSSGFEMEATLIDDSINLVEEESSETSKKRSAEDEPNTSTSEPPTKRVKKGETSGEQGSSGTQGEVRDSQGKTTPEVIDDKGKTPPEVKDDKGKTTTEDKDDKGNTPPGDKDVQEEITSEDTKKDCTSKPGEAATSVPCEDRPDEIEEALICTICQELLHDCISLQPCMHSFCAGCYSDWMDKSNECPTCRMKVERINKNHIVNNLIEAYLKENPNKKRDEEDLKELDAKNKISRDMLYSGSKRKVTIFDSSESDSSDSSSPVESPPPNTFPFSSGPAPLLGFGTPVFGTLRPAKTLCRQCPDYKDLLNAANTCTSATATPAGTTGVLGAIGKFAMNVFGKQDNPASTAGKEGATNTAAGSADSEATLPTGDEAQPGPSGEQPDPDVKVMPTAPAYSCAINQTHVLCQCCLQPMPDRRNEYMTNFPTTVPPQQCKFY